MRLVRSFIAFLAILPVIAFSQTQLWQKPSPPYQTIVLPDGNGNIFWAGGSDSVSKLDADGNIVWTVHLSSSGVRLMRHSGSGIYVLAVPSDPTGVYTISYVSDGGIVQWTKSFPSIDVLQANEVAVDRSGN